MKAEQQKAVIIAFAVDVIYERRGAGAMSSYKNFLRMDYATSTLRNCTVENGRQIKQFYTKILLLYGSS